MVEKWVPGWEGLYAATDEGEVISYHFGKRRVLRQKRHSQGYRMVTLAKNGKNTDKLVHHAVLEAFVGPRPDKYGTRHLDGERTNNRLGNLAWGTYSENNYDIVAHGRHYSKYKDVTHCKQGHEFTPENTRIKKRYDTENKTMRACRICERARAQEYNKRRKRG